VSPQTARSVYGVVLGSDGQADLTATAEHRAEIRAGRIGGKPAAMTGDGGSRGIALDANLSLRTDDGGAAVTCRHCATELGVRDGDLTAGLVVRDEAVLDALPGARTAASTYVQEDLPADRPGDRPRAVPGDPGDHRSTSASGCSAWSWPWQSSRSARSGRRCRAGQARFVRNKRS